MEVARFWRNTPERMKLIGEVCDNCGEKIFPPRDVCPKCKNSTRVNLGTIMEADGLWVSRATTGTGRIVNGSEESK